MSESAAIVATVMEHEQHALAPIISDDKMQILGDVIAPGLSKAELEVFAVACNRTRLDPFAKQICAIARWDSELGRNKLTIQTTIDGFRIIAERTGQYGGRKPFEWCGKDGVWKEVWLQDEPPAAARVRVIRKDWPEPLVAVARYKAYAVTKRGGGFTYMWTKMDAEQLAKCGEALALRTAFPQELSGLYTEDEMAQADNNEPTPPRAAPKAEPKAPTNGAAPKQPDPSPVPKNTSPVGPVVWVGWTDKRYTGRLLSGVPSEALCDYAAFMEALSNDPTRPRLRDSALKAMAATQAELDKRVAAEAEKALGGAQEPEGDAIAEGLQAEVDAKATGVGADENASWGLEPT